MDVDEAKRDFRVWSSGLWNAGSFQALTNRWLDCCNLSLGIETIGIEGDASVNMIVVGGEGEAWSKLDHRCSSEVFSPIYIFTNDMNIFTFDLLITYNFLYQLAFKIFSCFVKRISIILLLLDWLVHYLLTLILYDPIQIQHYNITHVKPKRWDKLHFYT